MTEQAPVNDPLLLKFAADHPEDFAALLANRDTLEVTELITGLPDDYASSIAARLPSWQLTRLLADFEPERLCRLLLSAPMDEAVALVSHLHVSRYPALREACPPEQRAILAELLEFPSHSLAALATTDFIRVSAETSCAEFAEQLANSTDTQLKPVLAVDRQGRYMGLVNLQAVYARRNRTKKVGEIASKVEALNGITDAASALTARQWMHHSEVPVVDQHHRLLGVVERGALERVAGKDSSLELSLEGIASELALGYLNLCGRLLEAALGQRK